MTTSPAARVTYTRTNNSPVWGGWLFAGMGAIILALRARLASSGSSEDLGLILVAAIFLVAGAVVVVRRFEQIITVEPRTKQVVVEDRTRFGVRRRVIRFDEIREVAVESHTDPDPDARPFQQTTHRVVARLRDGSAFPVTDFATDAAEVAKIRDEVVAQLEHGPSWPTFPPGRPGP